MTYSIDTTGSPHRKVRTQRYFAETAEGAATIARRCLDIIGANDDLHTGSTQDALAFWTPEQIAEDLDSSGQCAMNVCGGFYCVEIKA